MITLTMLALTTMPARAEVPGDSATWVQLQANPVKVECTASGKPYCRSTGVIGAPLATATDAFEHLDQHVKQMASITSVTRLEPDVLHVVMDYPIPFSDRDYVARFTHRTEADGTEVYAWTPVTHPAAPDDGSAVRLVNLDGEWRFKAEGDHTRVTYVWESDPGGNMPDASVVYKKAGTFAITDMANACGTKILSP